MLVLTRKPLEVIVVGSGIEHMLKVTVLEINGGKVKLGLEASPEIPILRGEIWEKMQANGQPGMSPEGFGTIKN